MKTLSILFACALIFYSCRPDISFLWTKDNQNPLDGIIGIPTVIKDGGIYKMWYGDKDGINYADSIDGIDWNLYDSNPIISMPEEDYPYEPSVIKNSEDTYEIWFASVFSPTYYSFSDDGINWSAPQEVINILFSSGSPMVIKDGSTYKMWHRLSEPDEDKTGYSTSSDGINWTPPELVLDVGKPSRWDDDDAVDPCVIKDGETYRMWYRGEQRSTDTSSIGYATSKDGINWIKYEFPIMIPDANWEGNDIHNPFVIKDGDIYKMWYADEYGESGMGYAYATTEQLPILD